jgi:BMFP domain-containing protein YqiC
MEMMKRFIPGSAAAPPAKPQSEVELLRQRIAELEARLDKPKPGKKRKSKAD